MPKHPPSTCLQQSCRRKPIVKPARSGNCMCCAGSFARVCLPSLLDDENMHVTPGTGAPGPRTRASARRGRAVATRRHGGRLANAPWAETGLRVCACAPPAMPRHARPPLDERGRCPVPAPGGQRPRFPTLALSRLQLCPLLGVHSHTLICRPPAWTTAYRAHTSISQDSDPYLLVELVDLDRLDPDRAGSVTASNAAWKR